MGLFQEVEKETADYTSYHIHGIDESNFTKDHNNFQKIWKEVYNIITSKSKEPILFSKGTQIEKYAISWLAEKAGEKFSVQIFEIEDLLRYLYDFYSELPRPQSFQYLFTHEERPIKCDFHKNLPRRLHCALGDARTCCLSVQEIAFKIGLIKEKKYPFENDKIETSDWDVAQEDIKTFDATKLDFLFTTGYVKEVTEKKVGDTWENIVSGESQVNGEELKKDDWGNDDWKKNDWGDGEWEKKLLDWEDVVEYCDDYVENDELYVKQFYEDSLEEY